MNEQVERRAYRRKLTIFSALCITTIAGFWLRDSYEIWRIWHDPNLCVNADCQQEMYSIFYEDVVQVAIYVIVSIVAVAFFLRNYDYRTKEIDKTIEIRQEVQDLYDHAPCGYHSLDANGIFIHINQTELNWLGYTREEVIGKMRLADLQETYSKEQFLQDFKDNLKGEGVRNLELNLRRRDGSLLPVLVNGTLIKDENGNFKHTRTTLTDFSEQRKLLNELEKARQIAEKSVETKERFMANMSHEIRTPMNALIGFTNLLERTKLNENQAEFVGTIKKAGENLLTLINDLLDFSKIEAGIEATPFELNGLVQSIETLFKPKANEKRVSFDVQTSPRIPQNVIGDPTRVTQIVVNLLSNAFKFTERGYVALKTELFDDNTDFATVKITVKDTGIGIEKEELPRVFERFQQAQDDTTRLYGGSGLGLAIVKNLAEAMGGFVEVDSKVGFGSTFSVVLPFKKVNSKDLIAQMSQVDFDKAPPQYVNDLKGNTEAKNGSTTFKNELSKPINSVEKTTNVAPTTQTPRILVVEDNPMNQRLAALLLSDWGYDFDIVEDGKDALEQLQKHDYQLVMMDIQLPTMDGYETTAIIRNTFKSAIPIIATTAHAFAGEREKCLAAGMNDYIPKPLQEEAVLAMIQKYIKMVNG
jgi:PAS domain S-box-containing protein